MAATELKAHGHRLQPAKCSVFVPALEREGGEPSPELAAFLQRVPRAEGAMPFLGAALQGDFETALGPFSAVAGPAAKRAATRTHPQARARATMAERTTPGDWALSLADGGKSTAGS